MRAEALIRDLQSRGICLHHVGDRLIAEGVLTDLDRAAIRGNKPVILAALAEPGRATSECRRQKVLAILARDGGQYAVYVENASTDPVIAALATPDGTAELLIPKDRYDPFEVLATVKEWEREDATVLKGRRLVRQGAFTGHQVKA